jgi:hypothetical protein
MLLMKVFDYDKIEEQYLNVVSVKSKSVNFQLLEKKLRKLREIYNIIYKNGDLINECVSYSVLVQVFVCTLTIIQGGYRVFIAAVSKAPVERIAGELMLLKRLKI